MTKQSKPSSRPSPQDNSKSNGVLIDNEKRTMWQHLNDRIDSTSIINMVSAYFTIYGFQTLQDKLNEAKEVKFLYGDPTGVGTVDPKNKQEKSYYLTEENELQPVDVLQQKPLAEECKKWIESDKVSVRSIKKSNFLHGKMYNIINSNPDGSQQKHSAIGSSNFTQTGLGKSTNSNIELNLAVEGKDACQEMNDWFDNIWQNNEETEDVKNNVIAALDRIGKEQSPEFIYFKTLYEIFKERLDEEKEFEQEGERIHFHESAIYNKLFKFQKDGAKGILNRLRKHNGCILADSVGLGKTYTALAVIKYYELNNKNVLVLCPKKLKENWSLYQDAANEIGNPLFKDKFSYKLLNHTDLSRTDEFDNSTGKSDGIDLSKFNWGNFDLVVIDESHNFRNDSRGKRSRDATGKYKFSRYEKLLEDIIKTGKKTHVLMLSATPINNSLRDLRNQIYLMTEKNQEHFDETIGIPNIREAFKLAERKFNDWSKKGNVKNKDELCKDLGGQFFNLLNEVSISRSRKHIEKYYDKEMEEIGGFPTRAKPQNEYPHTDIEEKINYEKLYEAIGKFQLSIYTPSEYLRTENPIFKKQKQEEDSTGFSQKKREHYLIGMMRVNFMKRLESSVHSFRTTLENTIEKSNIILKKIEGFQNHQNIKESMIISDYIDETEEQYQEDEEFTVGKKQSPIPLEYIRVDEWRQHIEEDKDALQKILDDAREIDPLRDAKLIMLKKMIQGKIDNPTSDKNNKECRKLLIFTAFSDTAKYLYEQLKLEIASQGINVALVTGTQCDSNIDIKDFSKILNHFAPYGRGYDKKISELKETSANSNGEIDILIATDCISEGQNLHDCDTVINYDIHWNPVRLMQRFGRIDRIGSNFNKIYSINYWPTEDLDGYINLKFRVEAKMALVDATATGDDNVLNRADEGKEMHADREKIIEQEIYYNNRKLKLYATGEYDPNESHDDEITMQDFTLDDFIAQLLQYISDKKDQLEEAPLGLYGVTDTNSSASNYEDNKINKTMSKSKEAPGIIFCFKQTTGDDDKPHSADKMSAANKANPLHPYMLVYVLKDGDVRYTYTDTKNMLTSFANLTLGKDSPDHQLCDIFNTAINNGKNMKKQEKLLQFALEEGIGKEVKRQDAQSIKAGMPRKNSLTEIQNMPHQPNNQKLVSWLVIY